MKIGIVTFYQECNYGAFLQALGTYTYLKKLGHNPEFINYNPHKDVSLLLKLGLHDGTFFNKIHRRYNIYVKYHLKKYTGIYLQGFADCRKKYFTESKHVTSEDELEKLSHQYHAIIVGSDQVWNTRKSGPETLYYFLNFFHGVKSGGKTRKISYAACFGQTEQSEKLMPAVKSSLLDFDAISVRNNVSQNVAKSCLGEAPIIVCDPTILLGDYSFAQSSYVRTHHLAPYCLVYCLDERQKAKHEKAIELLRRETGKQIVTITSSHHTAWTLENADENLMDVSPEDWLDLFAHADFVYTDSFHGAIFSLLGQKKFLVTTTNNERASRLQDLCKRYGIENRLRYTFEDIKDMNLDEQPNYEKINELMNEHRTQSLEFLTKALDK